MPYAIRLIVNVTGSSIKNLLSRINSGIARELLNWTESPCIGKHYWSRNCTAKSYLVNQDSTRTHIKSIGTLVVNFEAWENNPYREFPRIWWYDAITPTGKISRLKVVWMPSRIPRSMFRIHILITRIGIKNYFPKGKFIWTTIKNQKTMKASWT